MEVNKMKNDKIAVRIKKLLALANDSTSDHDSQAAMLLAQKMMAEHNLSMVDVDNTDLPTDKVAVDHNMSGDGRAIWWKKHLAPVIADNFKCFTYLKNHYGKYSVQMIGLKEDIEIASQVFDYARDAITRFSREYVQSVKRPGMKTANIKRDWIKGFIAGLDAKFKEQVDKNNWGLILVRDGLVEKKVSNLILKSSKRKFDVPYNGNWAANNAGFQKGQEFASNSGSSKVAGSLSI